LRGVSRKNQTSLQHKSSPGQSSAAALGASLGERGESCGGGDAGREQLDAIGFAPIANTPDEFAAVIKVESERWAKVIRAANLKAEP
jgi:hypothetical protein